MYARTSATGRCQVVMKSEEREKEEKEEAERALIGCG
jgi:hypothetical protein